MRSNPARGRPTWWVVLAVALALMALVAATATRSTPVGSAHRPQADATTTSTTSRTPSGAAATTTVPTLGGTSASAGGSGLSGLGALNTGAVTHTATTTSTTAPAAAPTTTTTQAPGAGDTTYPGFFQPPQNSSTTVGFPGQGATRVSATWSDATYLTLNVTCTGFNQSTGGSSALSLTIPDAQGSCQAMLSEPANENDMLTYTLVVSPGNGS
jgi:hypothetical protein